VLSILENFDSDVVIFHEDRTRNEWTHNTTIKDTMRNDGINANIVSFLLSRAVAVRQGNAQVSNKCLEVLSLFISWVDISLVVPQETISLLYSALGDGELWGGACLCLTETVKKGMPPNQKLDLLRSIGVLDVLHTTITSTASLDEDLALALGPLVDAVYGELLDVWAACEKSAEFRPLIPQAAEALHRTMTCVLPLFRHTNFDVALTLTPSLNRFAQLLKTQSKSSDVSLKGAFNAQGYLSDFLGTVYQQLQYENDFTFDGEDEDDCQVIEVSHRRCISCPYIRHCCLLFVCSFVRLFHDFHADSFATSLNTSRVERLKTFRGMTLFNTLLESSKINHGFC
jgi:hypothetical protein